MLHKLTLNGVKGSEGHFNMIPFQEAARPNKGLGEHYILIFTKGDGVHRKRLKLQRLVGGKLCINRNMMTNVIESVEAELTFPGCDRQNS